MADIRLATAADSDALVSLLSALLRQENEFSADVATQRRGLEAILSDPGRSSSSLNKKASSSAC